MRGHHPQRKTSPKVVGGKAQEPVDGDADLLEHAAIYDRDAFGVPLAQ